MKRAQAVLREEIYGHLGIESKTVILGIGDKLERWDEREYVIGIASENWCLNELVRPFNLSYLLTKFIVMNNIVQVAMKINIHIYI